MLRCVECGSEINLEQGTIVDCPECGIELEIVGNALICLQLGPSEE